MRARLSVMMALIYAVQGAFWPLLAVHLKDLGVGGPGRGWVFATFAIGSLVMPLGAGHLVDRLLAGERLLAAVFAAATVILTSVAAGWVGGAWWTFGVFLVYWLIVAPGFALSNTIALRHLEHPYAEFAGVRLWGTFGWMAAGWGVSLVMAATGAGAPSAFWVAAALAGALYLTGLTLPHTPPLASDGPARPLASLSDALSLARSPGMPVLLVTAFGVSLTTPFVYQVLPTYLEARGLPRAWIASAMSLGQWPEIAALAVLPWLLGRAGVKATLALGVGAWVVRYATLAADPPLWAAVAGIPLHGVGFACFTVAGQMYTDGQAPGDRRAGGQALYTAVTSGAGTLLGSLMAGRLAGRLPGDAGAAFFVPCVIDAALLVYFCAGFRPYARIEGCAGASHAARPLNHDAVRGAAVRVGNLVTESADG